ncbi:uncharacterized protein LOC135467147 [Liolophura sinensis]|uniref:uncharacterized protein LOC135467147 n=1 Tax=Liolophura sinensis TaxID=3198878 RepID=UPI0031589D7B
MRTIITSLCVCLFVTVVRCQNVKRPEVPARAVSDGEMQVIIDACQRRIAENDTVTHFVSVPSDCSAYAVCEHPELGVIPALMNCPAGLLFDDSLEPNILTCNRPGLVTCVSSVDPCTGLLDGYNEDFVRSQPNQAAYYLCRGGSTVNGGWCELGEQFGNFGQPCLPIPNFVPPQTTAAALPECTLFAVAEDPFKFVNGGIEMSCSPGTVFDQAQCTCVFSNL